VLCDLVEAILGVAFLQGGLDGARRACRTILGDAIAALEGDTARDPKSELQERAQRLGMGTPTYEVVGSGGSSHEPWFTVTVTAAGRILAEARGRSKRLSERAAAEAALSTVPATGEGPVADAPPEAAAGGEG
jgi:ribonuclease-3